VVFDDTDDVVRMGFEEDSDARKNAELFRYHRAKEEEEEKRLFYVGVTRAMDYLCLSGALEDPAKPQGKLHFLEGLDLVTPELEGRPFHVLHETEVPEGNGGGMRAPDLCKPTGNLPVAVGPMECMPEAIWKDVTEDMAPHTRSHGEHWTLIGTVMHILLDEISKGITALGDAEARVRALFRAHGAGDEHVGTVMADLGKLEASGLMESIIMPRNGGYAELPFVLKKGQFHWRGRIDRVVVEEGHVRVYDYKSFPVSESEMPEVLEKYRFQMATYREAAGRLFRLPASAHLVFTHLPRVVEVDS
jgi:ATP-dependent exoDNAse (exonuclease V) beta subunit